MFWSAAIAFAVATAGVALLAANVLAAGSADAGDPGAWRDAGFSVMPRVYYQGMASDPSGNMYFDGPFSGLYRTDAQLNETARAPRMVPKDVRLREGYNHLGDISWDNAEGGRVLLPLECFHPELGPGKRNTCNTGSIAVADPETLQWRYYVRLDPSEISKAEWNEVSPDGKLVWTSAGPDLLAYRTADITRANAAPAGPVLKAVRRVRRAVPPSGITGAAFFDGRLFVAGSNRGHTNQFQVWSIDLDTGARRLEIERPIIGESEGLDVVSALGGVLHWEIQPYNPENLPPTYGTDHATLLHFVVAPPCGVVKTGTMRNDLITGTNFGDKLEGLRGSDTLEGLSGYDCLAGGNGNDTLDGGAGNDNMDGGAGNDHVLASQGDDTLLGGTGKDVLEGSAGNDSLTGGAGDDKLVGGRGTDTFAAGRGNDVIDSADGLNETVRCGAGRDFALVDPGDTVVGCEKVVRRTHVPGS